MTDDIRLPDHLQPQVVFENTGLREINAAYDFGDYTIKTGDTLMVYRAFDPARTITDIVRRSEDRLQRTAWILRRGEVVENPPAVDLEVVKKDIFARYQPENVVIGPTPFAAGFMLSARRGFANALPVLSRENIAMVFRLDSEAKRFLPIDSALLARETALRGYNGNIAVMSDRDLELGKFITRQQESFNPIDPVAFRENMAGVATMAEQECTVVFCDDGFITVRLDGDQKVAAMVVDPKNPYRQYQAPDLTSAMTDGSDVPQMTF